MFKKILGSSISLLGLIGLLGVIFYGYAVNWTGQLERGKDLQSLADFSEFTPEELAAINTEVDVYVNRLKQSSKSGVDSYASELAGVQSWVNGTIRYDSDLRVYGVLEYLATAREVWLKKVDDCDGTAVLAAAILKSRGVKRAKVATSRTHAEARIGTTKLQPEPPRKYKIPWYKHLETQLDRIILFPWLRCSIGLLWFTLCCSIGMKIANGQLPKLYIFIALGIMFTACLALEYFTIRYLPVPMYQGIDTPMWVSLIFGVVVGGIASIIFIFGGTLMVFIKFVLRYLPVISHRRHLESVNG